jgi:hypothetical protein
MSFRRSKEKGRPRDAGGLSWSGVAANAPDAKKRRADFSAGALFAGRALYQRGLANVGNITAFLAPSKGKNTSQGFF